MGLIGFAIFVFVLVVQHREVRLVATLCDIVAFDGFQYGTARLVSVGAVRETTLLGEFKNLLEIAGQLLTLHIEGAKALDAWGVDEPGWGLDRGVDGETVDRYHLREGGTVVYEPITKIYRIYKMHALTAGPDRLYGDFYIGTVIYIFDQEVYNDVSVANRE